MNGIIFHISVKSKTGIERGSMKGISVMFVKLNKSGIVVFSKHECVCLSMYVYMCVCAMQLL